MNANRFSRWLFISVLMMMVVAVALWLRVALPYNQVFVGDWVKLTGVDAYYYMRLVDNLVRHFPQLTEFDPYMLYPGGSVTGSVPDFFAYLMGGIIWILGMGRPDQHLVDVIAVYIPPVLAALTVIGVYFIGRALASEWIGLLAAGLLAVMPGEFLSRSLLGYADHHIAEVLFSTVMMLFIFEFVRIGESRSLAEIKQAGRREIVKLVLYGILGGVFLGLYMLTWAGALLFVLILFVFQVVQGIVEHLRGKSVDYLGIMGICVYGIALLMYLPFARSPMTVVSLAIGLVISVWLMVLSAFMVKRKLKAFYYPVVIVGTGVLAMLLLYLSSPALFNSITGNIFILFSWNEKTIVSEMEPLLLLNGQFNLAYAWANFTTVFIVSLISLGLLIFLVITRKAGNYMLLLVWSLVALLAALAMRRFAYYYAVNAALLAGLGCFFLWRLIYEQTVLFKTRGVKYINAAIIAMFLFTVVYYPNLGPLPNGGKPAVDRASRPAFAPADAWYESMDWMRANTAEPLGNPEAYYKLFNQPETPGGFVYPGSAYGVLSWWDYGYLITRIGRRIPHSNPGSGYQGESNFFMANNEAEANKYMQKIGTKYVAIDAEMISYKGVFYAMAELCGKNSDDYFGFYLQKKEGRYVPVMLFYPEYYRTMTVRLYNFEGKAYKPPFVHVVNWEMGTDEKGNKVKVIQDIKKFSTYEEAQEFLSTQKSGKYMLISIHPFSSPMPLEALEHYRMVYKSKQEIETGFGSAEKVKIFEFIP